MAGSSDAGRERRVWAATIAGYLVLLAFDVWLLVVLPNAAWEDRAAFALQIVGLTSIATGFVAATELSKSFPALLDAMTSQNLRSFLYGNLSLSTVVFGIVAGIYQGLGASRGWYAWLPFKLLWLVLLPFVFAALIAYYVVVMPIAYVAYVAVSLPLLAIRDAQSTVVVRAGSESVDANALVARHIVPMRGFLAGLIATLFSVLTRVIGLY